MRKFFWVGGIQIQNNGSEAVWSSYSAPCSVEPFKDIEEDVDRKVGRDTFTRIPHKQQPLKKTDWDVDTYRKVEINVFGVLLSQSIRITLFSFHMKIYSGL